MDRWLLKENDMWENFFRDGGLGMYPTALDGFLTIAAAVVYILRPEPKYFRLLAMLLAATFASGLLGTTVGFCKSAHYISMVPKPEQFEILFTGFQEALHPTVLALLLVVTGAFLGAVGALRSPRGKEGLQAEAQAAK